MCLLSFFFWRAKGGRLEGGMVERAIDHTYGLLKRVPSPQGADETPEACATRSMGGALARTETDRRQRLLAIGVTLAVGVPILAILAILTTTSPSPPPPKHDLGA